jgi:hypothetical protein
VLHRILLRGRPAFTDVTAAVGLSASRAADGSNFGDLDNDGWLDIYLGTGEPALGQVLMPLYFCETRRRHFVDVTSAAGLGHLQKGHGVAFADFDNDGDQDLFEQMGGGHPFDTTDMALYENPAKPGAAMPWVTLVSPASGRTVFAPSRSHRVIRAEGERAAASTAHTAGERARLLRAVRQPAKPRSASAHCEPSGPKRARASWRGARRGGRPSEDGRPERRLDYSQHRRRCSERGRAPGASLPAAAAPPRPATRRPTPPNHPRTGGMAGR